MWNSASTIYFKSYIMIIYNTDYMKYLQQATYSQSLNLNLNHPHDFKLISFD